MATVRQRNLAREIVANASRKNPKNKKEMVVSSGYDLTTAEKQIPAVFEQKGVRETLEEFGFTESNAKKVVSEIMLDSEKDANARLKATDQVFKVHGSYQNDDTKGGKTLIINITGETAERYGLIATQKPE